jgi:DNA mismatch repair ATPase MutS
MQYLSFLLWKRAVQCLSILDVLLSLTNYVKNCDYELCRPTILYNDDFGSLKPFIEIINGYHPCLTKTFSGDFIPNDVVIGSPVS